jgi:hypothetical protein
MNTKKLILTFIIVFVLFEITNYLIHGIILAPLYEAEQTTGVFRSQEAMTSNMWIIMLTDLVWAFFFVFFFAKGYENRGISEGLRFGFYMGLFFSMVVAYQGYSVHPIPYALAFQWFIYGMIQALILGVTAALIYKSREAVSSRAATV